MPKQARPPLTDLAPRRICLVKPSALGDVVQTLPLATMLRARWPKAEIAWVVNRSLAELLRGHPDLAEVIEFDRGARGGRQALAFARLLGRLRRGRFDLALDLQGLLRSGLMTLAAGAGRSVGFDNAREGATLAYTDRVAVPEREMPTLDRYVLIARALGCVGPVPAAKLPLTPSHQAWAEGQLAGLPRPVLAIHPGASWETKRWPVEQFATLAQWSRRDFGAAVVLVGGPGERALCQAVADRLAGPVVNLAERTGLLELAAVSRAADVFLAGDSGPMHLAAAVGTPVVSLFTCTSPARAAPRGSEHRVVATEVVCAGSYLKRCGWLACMRELAPARVWPRLQATLAEVIDRPLPRRA